MFKIRSRVAIQWLLCLLVVLPRALTAQTFTAERLNGGEPIVSARQFQQQGAPAQEGENINGPSVIRIPDWIPPARRAAPDARYYLYFAHHSGDYIRLAWARDIEGPWQLYRTGAGVERGKRGVLDMGIDRRIPLGNGLAITSHIASPDVHVDDESQRIVMYFHGVTRRDGSHETEQQTYVATAPTGLDFSTGIVPYPLSGNYLRVFEFQEQVQGLTPSKFHRPRNSAAPWEVPEDLSRVEQGLWESHKTLFLKNRSDEASINKGKRKRDSRPRHLGLYRSGNTLHVFFTRKGHSPERILVTALDLTVDDWYRTAATAPPAEVLRPEREWEGGMLAPTVSRKGPAAEMENALRDPFIFNDGDTLYLFYAGGGEQAIGLARLTHKSAGM